MIPEKVDIEAILRSISAHRSTNVMPVAATAMGPTWVMTFCRLRVVRNTSVAKLKNVNIAASVTNGARILALRLAQRAPLVDAQPPTEWPPPGAVNSAIEPLRRSL